MTLKRRIPMNTLKIHFQRLIAAATACMLSAALLHLTPNAMESHALLLGDCSGDGVLNAADAKLLAAHLTQQYRIQQSAAEAADCNSDGVVDGEDLTLLKRMLLYPAPKEETVTLMVYMCGSDLETEAYQATTDLYEILDASLKENFHVTIATGGAKQWHEDNEYVDHTSNYYMHYSKDGVESVPVSGGQRNMASAETLSDFITASVAAYPADRYALVLWDHGGGPIYGLCYDEIFDETMFVDILCTALDTANVHFDWIGFDACLMGTAEVAYAMRSYADYMIASQELESGLGWSYTEFIEDWSENPSISTEELAETIMVATVVKNILYQMDSTLALYDLSYADAVMQALYAYGNDLYQMYRAGNLSKIMKARSQALDFGKGEYDLVDLVDFVQALPTANSPALLAAMEQMVISKYNYRLDDASGLSMWFFENYPDEAYYLDYTMKQYGINSQYLKQLSEMANAYEKSSFLLSEPSLQDDAIIIAFHQMMGRP